MTLGQGKAASSKGWCSAYSFIYTHLTKKMMYQCNKMRINESAHFNSENGNQMNRLNRYCKNMKSNPLYLNYFLLSGLTLAHFFGKCWFACHQNPFIAVNDYTSQDKGFLLLRPCCSWFIKNRAKLHLSASKLYCIQSLLLQVNIVINPH